MKTVAQRALITAVRGYRLLLSPWLGNACRFEPTCSAYAVAAIEAHGALAGTALTLGRIARCQPWCVGGHDPVPAEAPRFLTRLLRTGDARRAPGAASDHASP